MVNFPRQKISEKEKLAEPKDTMKKSWGRQCVDAIIDSSKFNKRDNINYYRAYNGEINAELYEHLTNPFKAKNPDHKRYPAKIRNYNIIKPVVDLLLGEKSKQPLNWSVICTNPDVKVTAEEKKQELIYNVLQQKFINELNASGVDTGIESQETPDVSEVIKEFERSYKDNRVIDADSSLRYLYQNLNLKDTFQEAFFDWLVSGEVYTYKGISYDDVEYELVNAEDLDYYISPGTRFIEDAQWVCRKRTATPNDIIDKFREYLTEEQIDRIENPYDYDDVVDMFYNSDKNTYKEIGVYHCVWKSFRKIGFLTYIDELGEIQSMIVDETFKIDDPETQSVEWEWITQAWEGYRLGRDIYVGIKPIDVQRNELNNISLCKLPYNGRVYSNKYSKPISVVSIGIPYQILYNIFHFKLELSIAKHKDSIVLMEINTIPKRHGWDEEKFMYWADANGFAFIDSTAIGKGGDKVSFNQFQVLESKLGDYISKMFELLMSVKQEWEDTLGITRQRKGQTLASDAVGNNERAIFQSSIMTEELNRKFDNFIEKEFNGLLDVSKEAWKFGKKATFLNSDYRQEFLNIEETNYKESEFSVFVSNSNTEAEKINTLKQMALQFVQNGVKPSTIAEILDSENFTKIKNKLMEVEKIEQEMAAQQQQAEQESAERIEQMQLENREDIQAHQMEIEQLKSDTAILIKQMDIENKPEQPQEDNSIELKKIQSNESLKRDELRVKERIEDKKNKTAKEVDKMRPNKK